MPAAWADQVAIAFELNLKHAQNGTSETGHNECLGLYIANWHAFYIAHSYIASSSLKEHISNSSDCLSYVQHFMMILSGRKICFCEPASEISIWFLS